MKKAALPLAVLLAFTAYTVFAMSQAEQSLIQFGMELMSGLDTAQVVIDLYILAALACIWMYQDNKARNKPFTSVAPYIVITVFFVSIAPCSTWSSRAFQRNPVQAIYNNSYMDSPHNQ